MVEINIFQHAVDTITLQAGETVFREGDGGDVMFAVVEGSVAFSGTGRSSRMSAPAGIFGEMALIGSADRSATAQALTTARVVRVGHDEFTYLVQEYPTFALRVVAIMDERLRRANEHSH